MIKVKITPNVNDPDLEFRNIHPQDQAAWDLLDAGEIDHLSLEVVDYIPAQFFQNQLQNYIGKVASGGKLTVTGLNVNTIARGIINRVFDLNAVNQLLYGHNGGLMRTAIYNISFWEQLFKNSGFTINSKRLGDVDYTIEGTKP